MTCTNNNVSGVKELPGKKADFTECLAAIDYDIWMGNVSSL